METLQMVGAALVALVPLAAFGGDIQVTENKATWLAWVGDGEVTVLDFVFRVPQFLDDQYLDQGVTFPDTNDFAEPEPCFKNDGWGATGGFFGPIQMVFATPQNWIAAEFCGFVQFDLYYLGTHVYMSPPLNGEPGPGMDFGGVASCDQPFDEVLISDPADGEVYVDDILFGALDSTTHDLNSDGFVDGADLGILLGAWGTTGPGDLDNNGVVDGADLGLLLAGWSA